jgi:hypothetical protein
MKSVYSAVRIGYLNKAVCASSLEGLSMTEKIHFIYWLTLSIDIQLIHRYTLQIKLFTSQNASGI